MAKKVVKKITKIEPVSNGFTANAVEVKRVCAYCRVSTNSADQKNSFEAQVDWGKGGMGAGRYLCRRRPDRHKAVPER